MLKEVPCFRNLMENCPDSCPLHQKAVSVFTHLANANGITFKEAVAKTRDMNPTKKAEVQTLIEGGLVIAGVSGFCITKDTPKSKALFG